MREFLSEYFKYFVGITSLIAVMLIRFTDVEPFYTVLGLCVVSGLLILIENPKKKNL